jgi:hypothetical protein
MSAVIFSGSKVKTLKKAVVLNEAGEEFFTLFGEDSLDPQFTPVPASLGSMLVDRFDGRWFKKIGPGDTDWVEVLHFASLAGALSTYVPVLTNHSTGKVTWEDSIENYSKDFISKDSDGIFTTIEWYDRNDFLRKRSVLTGTGPLYDTRTVTWYIPDTTHPNVILIRTQVYSLTYDVDGDLITEDMV